MMGRFADIHSDGLTLSTVAGGQVNITFLLSNPHPLEGEAGSMEPAVTVRLSSMAAKVLQQGLETAMQTIEETTGPIEIPDGVRVEMRTEEGSR